MKTWIIVTMWITSDSGLLLEKKNSIVPMIKEQFDHAHEATSYKEDYLSSFSNSWMLYCWKYWVAYFLLVQFTIVLTPLFFLCSVSLHLTLLSNTLPWTFPQCFCLLSLSVLILRIFYTACWKHHFQVMTILNIYLFVCLS